MQTVAPLITALISLSLAVSVLIRDRRDRIYRRYAIFAGTVALAFFCMFFYVMTERMFWRYGVLIGALLAAPTSMQVYHLLLRRYKPATGKLVRVFYVIAAIQAVILLVFLGRLEFFEKWVDLPDQKLVAFNGLLVFSGLIANVVLLFRIRGSVEDPVDKARLRYLAIFGGTAVVLLLGEQAIQQYNIYAGGWKWGWGIIPYPPVGTLAAAVYIYFLGRIILLYRLLDLHEIIAQMTNFLLMSVLLAAVYVGLVFWPVGEASVWTSVVNTLLATATMLIVYAPLREIIDRGIMRLFFKERHQLERAVNQLLPRLPGIFAVDALVDELLQALVATSRVESASVYLWNDEIRAYRMIRHLGEHSLPELQRVPSRPFAEGLLRRRAPVLREEFRRLALHNQVLPPPRTDADTREREWQTGALHTLEGMGADISLPFLSGRSVLGWLNLSWERGNVGFSRAEIVLVGTAVERVALGIDNSRQFERMKDRDRLAALGEMSAGLAHEIRNPLGAIKGAAQVLEETGAADGQEEFLAIIVEEVDRLNVVVSQFLDYARPIKLDLEPVSVGRMLRSLEQVARTEGLPEGVELFIDINEDIPPIPMDVEKIHQVLLNLVRNGFEAMPEGGTLTLEASYIRALRRVRPLGSTPHRRRVGSLANPLQGAFELAVSDTGVGITPETMSRLFIPFYTTKNGGNGLGLPICERIVREHEGEFEVISNENEGSRFIIRLPMSHEDKQEPSSLALEQVSE